MAVTILRSPKTVAPASNPIVWEFSSDETAQPNFSFLVELSVNGSVYNVYQVFPEDGTTGKFDAMEIARAFTRSPFKANFGVHVGYNEIYAQLSIRVRDKYGNPPVPQGSFTGASSDVFAFNGALKDSEFINWDFVPYNLFQTDGALVSTQFPRSEKLFCGLGERIFLGIANSDQSPDLRAIVSLYDVNGNFINGATPTVQSERMNIWDLSPIALIDAGAGITGVDFDTCFYYEVIFRRQTAAPTNNSETIRIYIDRECSRYPSTRLHFLNKFGVWDSFTFNRLSRNTTDVDSTHYQQNAGRWINGQWTYNLQNGSLSTISKTSSDNLTLNTDWLSEPLQKWLVETLLESPAVYMEVDVIAVSQGSPSGSDSEQFDQVTVFEPVNVVNANYEKKQRVNSAQIRETIEIKRTYKYTSQLG